MTNPAFNSEDPRLTAFVLDEIDDSDRAEIEQLLETSTEARAAVKEIEETIGVLKEGLAGEPTPELTTEQRAAVEAQLSGPSVSLGAESGSPERSSFGTVVGGFLSVVALGVMAALVLPAVNNANQSSQFASEDVAATSTPKLMAMNDASELEESSDFGVAADTSSSEKLFLETKVREPRDEILDKIIANDKLRDMRLTSEKRQLPSESYQFKQQVAQLNNAGSHRSRTTSQPFAEGRSGNNLAKRDGAQPEPTMADKNSKDLGLTSRSKGPTESQTAQRLIADTGSRPPSNGSRQRKVGGGARPAVTNQPRSAPFAAGESLPENGSDVSSKGSSQSNKGALVGNRGDAVVDSPEPASAAALLPEQAVKTLPAPGRNSAGLQKSDRSVAFVPDHNESKKRIPFKENRDASGKTKAMDGPVPVSEAAVVKQVRDQEEALIPGAKTEQLTELSKTIAEKQKQIQLAAIDSRTTRKDYRRGLGLEGRDLQEQLSWYSENLSLARNSQEKMPEEKINSSIGFGSEYYATIVENDFIVPVPGDKEKSLSTISVDVDTASYANMRRFLNRDQLPPANSVRIEELVNYFKYNYPEPEGDEPFSVKTELAACPWQPSHRLAMVGLKAKTIEKAQRPPTNLVFLLDVSGSMRASNKLPLVQQSMRLLVEEMTEDDRVSIVTYASNAGVRLQSTLGSKKQDILNAINGLRAGGSTNGEGGIRIAYDEANRHYFQGGANRVILCSDGDFNVGKSSDGDLVELIQEKAASGVFLSVFGFGMGNLKDGKLEKIADKGNGHYGYIDNLNEARKVFQDELVGTLYTVAKDVKLQVEFNPATVGAYRLIGYENRKLDAQDFTDDSKDAGEIGSGHTVTALYEIIPKQVLLAEPNVDGLKYQSTAKKPASEGAKETAGDAPTPESSSDSGGKPVELTETSTVQEELLTIKLRYKKPDEEISQPVFQNFVVKDVRLAGQQLSAASDDLMFAASVASFGMNLRGSKYRGNWGFAEALETAQGAQNDGSDAQRTEFIQLVQRAMRITGQQTGPQPRTSQGTTTRPGELAATEARIKASVSGKYRRLVKKIEVRDDFQRFGAFNDYGHWDGTEYSGHKDLPPGNWVYVYPNWYIWAEAIVPPVEDKPAVEAAEPRGGEDKPATEKSAVK